jgi:hypothetical protein
LQPGAVAPGFGLWYFAVPGIYGWQSYVPIAPRSPVDAVSATNFFMSVSLSLVGVSHIVMPMLADSATPLGRYWLWANVGLWTTRAVYQLVKPQGGHNALLQWGMAGAFVVTGLPFIVAALKATLQPPGLPWCCSWPFLVLQYQGAGLAGQLKRIRRSPRDRGGGAGQRCSRRRPVGPSRGSTGLFSCPHSCLEIQPVERAKLRWHRH